MIISPRREIANSYLAQLDVLFEKPIVLLNLTNQFIPHLKDKNRRREHRH